MLLQRVGPLVRSRYSINTCWMNEGTVRKGAGICPTSEFPGDCALRDVHVCANCKGATARENVLELMAMVTSLTPSFFGGKSLFLFP